MLKRVRISKKMQISCIIILLFIVLACFIAIPTLGRFQSKIFRDNVLVWDGTIASSYKGSGTKDDPYIISNGSELALFSQSLKTTDYADTYFLLENDIVLNDGYFVYDETNKLQYIKNNVTYYVKDYTNELYESNTLEGAVVDTLNIFPSLGNFKGQLNGDSHTIYGLYIGDNTTSNLSLFNDLEGNVSDLFFANSIIYGKNNVAGLAVNTNNATISNFIYDGYVISNDNPTSKTTTINLEDITLDSTIKTVDLSTNSISDYVTNITLTGKTNNINELIINDNSITSNDFSITLNDYKLEISSLDYQNTVLSELKLEITYFDSITAGLISNATNTSLNNVINRSDVYSNAISSGLIGKATDVDIKNSYNKGSINSSYLSSGLTAIAGGNSNFSNCYNSGSLASSNKIGLIGNIYNASINITNCFNASDSNYIINDSKNSTIQVNNSYYTSGNVIKTGLINGTFNLTDITNLQNKDFLINNLQYYEFIDIEDLKDNEDNLYIYEESNYPVLYFDEINTSTAMINLGNYSYNTYSNNLDSLKYKEDINAIIENSSPLIPNKELSYYIYEGNTPLSIEEVKQLQYIPYDDVINISNMGEYIIYVKALDYDSNVTYLNTDILVLDNTDAIVNITMDDYEFNSYKTSLDNIYTNKIVTLNIEAIDDLSTITDVEYLITNEVKTKEELDESAFTKYEDEIIIEDTGSYIIYAKVTDNYNDVTYVNTDYIIIDGYKVNKLDNTDITDKSNINLNISYGGNVKTLEGYKHILISNLLLPVDTLITLIDNTNQKVYTYKTTNDDYGYNDCEDGNCQAAYPFDLFKEVGKDDNTTYQEKALDENIEDYDIKLSFENTSIEEDLLDVSLSLILKDKDNNIILNTLENSLKKFNVYRSKDATISLTTEDTINNIYYNSNSLTELNFMTKLNYQKINDAVIIDTTYQNKNFLLLINLLDENNNIVGPNKLKNITFKFNDELYYPDSNGTVKINLPPDITEYSGKLVFETFIDNSDLNKGTYLLSITSSSSIDGIYEENISTDSIEIPVIVDSEKSDYDFDIKDSSFNKIISNDQEDVNFIFDIESNDNSDIRVSLYRKLNYTAYDQDYTLIDLKQYISNDLQEISDKVYTLNNAKSLELKFIPSSLDPGGYEIVFELYVDNIKKGTIEKKFIVK